MKSNLLKSLSLLTVIGGSFVSCSQQSTEKKPEKPNILYIMSDDHAFQAISAYGHNLNKTPNIDRIATEGAIFTKGFVTNSICAPSRAVMLTGKHSFVNGKVDNMQPFNWDQENFPKILRRNGYQTAMIGKIHLDGLPQGFDFSMVLKGQGNYYNPDFLVNGEMKRMEGYCTEIVTETALDWLKNKRDQEKPFCMLYHQKAPHRNWKPAPKYLTLYDDTTFTPPATFFDDYEGRGTAAKEQEMKVDGHAGWGHDFKMRTDPDGNPTGFARELERLNDEQREQWLAAYTPKNEAMKAAKLKGKELAIWKYNRYIKDYLRTIKSVDDGVGEVLDYLEEAGLAENTIVVYTSDQGFYLGEHGWFDKRFMYEESFRTPILMKYPKEIKPGTVVDELIQNLDFAPTFLDYAGLDIPDDMQGKSFRKIVSGESSEWRDAIYYTYYEYPSVHMVKRHYGVRTDRYKLMHFYYDIDEWEMYDLEEDPNEMHSVYDDPAYADVQKMMHERLAEMRAKYGDSDENDQHFLKEYLDAIAKRK
ncbi:sulfatase family protein [Sunxiuqinia sp. A32]|uniref:sulfatase family protein n=1 Tax=Sunxiuqinia sp. A32 TaxID=3461496 RepID=UPI0040467554